MGREKKHTIESGGGCQVGQGAAGKFRGENRKTSLGSCSTFGCLGTRQPPIWSDSSASRASRKGTTTIDPVGLYFDVFILYPSHYSKTQGTISIKCNNIRSETLRIHSGQKLKKLYGILKNYNMRKLYSEKQYKI